MAVVLVLVLPLGVLPLAAQPASAAEPAPSDRPNILFLFADDQRADTIGAWGNEWIDTPNLDRLAAEGLSFERNYTFGSNSGAVCVPSRAMVLTGRSWMRSPNDMRGVPTLPRELEAVGYRTFITGKWYNGEEALLRRSSPTCRSRRHTIRAGRRRSTASGTTAATCRCRPTSCRSTRSTTAP